MDFSRKKHSYMQPRLEQVDEAANHFDQEQSEIQKMLDRRKGFDIIESEELYHMMHNPYYNEWKEKRDQMINRAA